MENATKALLIAAGVLIVIVIVALGVKILGGAGDTGKSGEQVGKEISSATEQASYNLKLQNYELIYGPESITKEAGTNTSSWYEIVIVGDSAIKEAKLKSPIEYNKKYLISIDSVTDARNTSTLENLNEFDLILLGKTKNGSRKAIKFAGDIKSQTYTLNANCKELQHKEIKILEPRKWNLQNNEAARQDYLEFALYCGKAGKTTNNIITFNGIRIYKEK